MSFNILYIENNDRDWNRLKNAVKVHNDSGQAEVINLQRAFDPDEFKQKLDLMFDAVLADVYFSNDKSDLSKDDTDRLDDILRIAKEWHHDVFGGRPIPIIAYTGAGQTAIEAVLKRKDELFDIWDKNTTRPEYVVWRLSRLNSNFPRIRPDALLQRLIRQMPVGASWHHRVIEMAREYDSGWTERDQLERVENPIRQIGSELSIMEFTDKFWKLMKEWEPLGHTISEHARGHSRHVINVFWLGYYLIHNPALSNWFSLAWQKLIRKRANMEQVDGIPDLEAISIIWFITGIYHDIGCCVEKANDLFDKITSLLSNFTPYSPSISLNKKNLKAVLLEEMNKFILKFPADLQKDLEPAFRSTIDSDQPDQGLISSLILLKHFSQGKTGVYVAEATRAISLHNVILSLCKDDRTIKSLNWEDEPILCLLLLTDQLQTWDRDQHNTSLKNHTPSRAELSHFEIKSQNSTKVPVVEMHIDYIAPPHLAHNRDLYIQVKSDLESVLLHYPCRALKRISGKWPFELVVKCSLSGDPLSTHMCFGKNET